jgi:sulfur carrier protein ThiS
MSQIKDSTRADPRTITVAVIFFADLRRFLPRGADGPQRYTISEGATVADLLAAIGVEADAEVTIAVDGELAGRDTPLRDSVEVMLLNPMEGGAAAAGEATTQMEGGAAAAGEATTQMNGGAAGEATTHTNGG